MALGNLILTAYAKVLGDFEQAVEAVARMLHCWARVLPVPSSPPTLCARLADDSVVRGEVSVRATGKSPVATVFLEPDDARVSEACLQAIHEADLVVLGPGGLYCSVLASLLPLPIRQAIRGRRGKTAYVCNTSTQPGQTDGFDAAPMSGRSCAIWGKGSWIMCCSTSRSPRRTSSRPIVPTTSTSCR